MFLVMQSQGIVVKYAYCCWLTFSNDVIVFFVVCFHHSLCSCLVCAVVFISRLLSSMYFSLLMIVMAPPLSASFITIFLLLDNTLGAICCCLVRLGLTLFGMLETKFIYWSFELLTNESVNVFLPLRGVQIVLLRCFITDDLLASPIEHNY